MPSNDFSITISSNANNIALSTQTLGPVGPSGTSGTSGIGIPVGGTVNQVLAKASSTNYDVVWVDQTGGGGSGLNEAIY
jgi:hypothetical protein